MKRTRDRIICWVILLWAVLMPGCSPSIPPTDPGAAPTSSPALVEITPTPLIDQSTQTPTPTPLPALSAPSTTPLPQPPNSGELEVRFTDPETQQECVGSVPFTIQQGDNPSIDGGGAYECAFEKQQCGEGVCVMYHSSYALDFTLPGQILPPTSDYPNGSLDAAPALDFTMKQWWSDIPPETMMPFTEENPFKVEGTDILTLFFKFEDGARAEIPNPTMPDAPPMVFILHLSP